MNVEKLTKSQIFKPLCDLLRHRIFKTSWYHYTQQYPFFGMPSFDTPFEINGNIMSKNIPLFNWWKHHPTLMVNDGNRLSSHCHATSYSPCQDIGPNFVWLFLFSKKWTPPIEFLVQNMISLSFFFLSPFYINGKGTY